MKCGLVSSLWFVWKTARRGNDPNLDRRANFGVRRPGAALLEDPVDVDYGITKRRQVAALQSFSTASEEIFVEIRVSRFTNLLQVDT